MSPGPVAVNAAVGYGYKVAGFPGVIEVIFIDILEAASRNDELAREVVTSAAIAFGTGLSNYVNFLNPGIVILSSPVISHSDLFYNIAMEIASKKINQKGESTVVFRKGGYFQDYAISFGAALMVVENFLNSKMLS